MQLTLNDPQIWVCNQPVDFRRSIDGLCAIVVGQLGQRPQDGIYIFYNRTRDRVKVLGWHRNGFVLIYKRLEQGRFHAANQSQGTVNVDERQLTWLLAGLDWPSMSNWSELEYDEFT